MGPSRSLLQAQAICNSYNYRAMGRQRGPKTYVMRLSEAERDLVLAYRHGTPSVPSAVASAAPIISEANAAISHDRRGAITERDPYLQPVIRARMAGRCPACGGLLGEFRKGKRTCLVCRAEAKA